MTVNRAAEAVLEAVRANDQGALRTLAERDKPDPWQVAEVLCRAGEHEAALTFAEAAPRPDTEGLPAYVDARRGRLVDPEVWRALEGARAALARKDYGAVVAITSEVVHDLETVPGIQLRSAQGWALTATGRAAEGSQALHEAGQAALRIGWRSFAAGCLLLATWSTPRRDRQTRLDRALANLALQEGRDDLKRLATARFLVGEAWIMLKEYERALPCLEAALALQRRLGEELVLPGPLGSVGPTLRWLSYVHRWLGNHDLSIRIQEGLLRGWESQSARQETAFALKSLRETCFEASDYERAIDYGRRALRLYEDLDRKVDAAAELSGLGFSFHKLEDYSQAIEHYERARAIFEEFDDRPAVARMLTQIGAGHVELGDFEEARQAFARTRAACVALGDRAGAAGAQVNLGIAYDRLQRYDEALATLTKGLEEAEACGQQQWAANALHTIGDIHRMRGAYGKALAFYQRSRALNEKLGNRRGIAKSLQVVGDAHLRRGAYAEASSALQQALAIAEKLPKEGALLHALLSAVGRVHLELAEYRQALSHYERALKLARERGRGVEVGRSLMDIGSVHRLLSEYESALSYLDRARKIFEELEDETEMAACFQNLGIVYSSRGDFAQARDYAERALALHEKTRGFNFAATLGSLGLIHDDLGNYPEALAFHRRSLALAKELGLRAVEANALHNMGVVEMDQGNYTRARSSLERALAVFEEIGDREGVAAAHGNLGNLSRSMGDYPAALSHQECALRICREIGARDNEALALGNLGTIHDSLGDPRRAIAYIDRARALHEETGNRAHAALELSNLGSARAKVGETAGALEDLRRAVDLAVETGSRRVQAAALGETGRVYLRLGEHRLALDHLERALALAGEIGFREDAAALYEPIGRAYRGLGDDEKARPAFEDGVRVCRRIRLAPDLARALGSLARLRLDHGDASGALLTAQQAVATLEGVLGGLGEEEGAVAREQYTDVFEVGTLAARRLEEPAEALFFLDGGRAGALLETLGGRRSLAWSVLPEELRQAEIQAKAAEAQARLAYNRALDTKALREIQRTRRALDEAREGVRENAARIQREAKREADLFYPRAATLEEVQGWLEDHTVLVLYGLCLDEALALVLTNDSERIVSLGSVEALRTACAKWALLDRSEDAEAALATLRKALVDPLALPASVTTVLVSPEGPLSYVPFGALIDDRCVAQVPSGTTYALLREETWQRGSKVLALGDPDYGRDADAGAVAIYRGGVALEPLPGTRAEAKAIGDVVLLGPEASEPGLRAALREETRWRAVHFACHGLVDPERPTLSSLALTRVGEDDGFLTALEVLRMDVPSDLVVLSACKTGKGKIVKGEGIVGLTRVFMYAGSPRVICSLWDVEDEATQALMIKFYELWNPKEGKGLGAAAALRKAQEFIRSHEEWKHPHYWAAWVLWGLPD